MTQKEISDAHEKQVQMGQQHLCATQSHGGAGHTKSPVLLGGCLGLM